MSSKNEDTYRDIERAYGEGDFHQALKIAKQLAQQLSEDRAEADQDSIVNRLLLLTGHIYLYGLNQTKEAQEMYEAVLANNANTSLSELAQASLNTCTLKSKTERNQEESNDTESSNQINLQDTPAEPELEINQPSHETHRDPPEAPAAPWLQELTNPEDAQATLEKAWSETIAEAPIQSSTSDSQPSESNAEPWAKQTATSIAPNGTEQRPREDGSPEEDLTETTPPAIEIENVDPAPTETNPSPDKKELDNSAEKETEENLECLEFIDDAPVDEAQGNALSEAAIASSNSQPEDSTRSYGEQSTESDSEKAEEHPVHHFDESDTTEEEKIDEGSGNQISSITPQELDATANEEIPGEPIEECLEEPESEGRLTQLEVAETTDESVLEAADPSLETDATTPNYASGDLVVEVPPPPPTSESENRPQQPQERGQSWRRFFKLKRT